MTAVGKLFVQPYNKNFRGVLAFANRNFLNIEIGTFAFPDNLDGDWRKTLKAYKKALKGFRGVISVHGPFQDMLLHSRDSRIRAVAESRIFTAARIAESLGAKFLVFHTNLYPLINRESYRRHWVEANTAFWRKITAAHSPVVLLENLWDPTPDLLKEVVDSVGKSKIGVCLDVAHVNVFSEAPLERWFKALGDRIKYIHVNDNRGEKDEELVPGEGNINWKAFTRYAEKYCPDAVVVLELNGVEKTAAAYNYFKKNGIYPFMRR